MTRWAVILAAIGSSGATGAVPAALNQVAVVTILGVCNPDSRLTGGDIQAFVACLAGDGSDCACWDLNDNGVVDGPDIPPAVTTLLNNLPYALNDHFVAALNQSISGNVLSNDLDPFGPGTTAVLDSGPSQGTLNLSSNGDVTYTPSLNFSGHEAITYRAVNAHGSSSSATVNIHICSGTSANCDGDPRDGCETATNTLTNCGGCGIPCSIANAIGSCATGTCALVGCNNGFSNCDGGQVNGCEVQHSAYSNTCATAESVGSACGDVNQGFLCPVSGFQTFATRSARNSRWLRARARECSSCCANVQARITLQVPAATDYDLYTYSACGVSMGSSTNGPGVTDQVLLTRTDDCGQADDSFDYWIEVRWVGGASCTNWTLILEGRN